MKRPFAALLLLGACACDAPSIADPPISKVEKPNQEKSQEDRREHEAGFWLSRRGQGKYEIVVVSLNKPESGDDATAIASGQIGLNQDFARAAIRHNLRKASVFTLTVSEWSRVAAQKALGMSANTGSETVSWNHHSEAFG